MSNIHAAAEVIASAMLAPSFKAPEARPLDAARALADAGLLAPDCMTYEYGDNGWDDETNSPMHYPVEPSCRDDDHECPEPAPPRYRRLVGPWEVTDATD